MTPNKYETQPKPATVKRQAELQKKKEPTNDIQKASFYPVLPVRLAC
jgi:hypothetical protein